MDVPAECAADGPLFSGNKMKLGVFGLNVSSAGAITKAPDRHEISWENNLRLVRAADAAGFEAAVPFARWRGFGGDSDPWGQSFETFTWAAGLAAATSKIALVATVNMLTCSPVAAAKQLATIDHISGGRAVLNVVAGWFAKEMKMFGVGKLGHDERYAYGDEWMTAFTKLMIEQEEFDLHGKYISLEGAYQRPKGLQLPRPPIMNAAFSPVGHSFAARHADIAFVSPDARKPGGAAAQVESLRPLAVETGRPVQVWVAASVVAAPTEQAAHAYVSRYAEDYIDVAAVDNMMSALMGGAQMPYEQRQGMRRDAAAHAGGYPLVGSYQKVADEIGALADAGVEGLCLTWMDFEHGLPNFIEEVLPLLKKAGLR